MGYLRKTAKTSLRQLSKIGQEKSKLDENEALLDDQNFMKARYNIRTHQLTFW